MGASTTAEIRFRLSVQVLVLQSAWLLLFALLTPGAIEAAPAQILHREIDRQRITGGVELIRIRQFDSLGWLNITALEIDHTEPQLRIDALLGNDRLTGSQPLSKTARERGAIAGINGDFFHILTTKAPIGLHLQSGELFKSPPAESNLATGFHHDAGSPPFIGIVTFTGTITAADGSSRDLNGWNEPDVPPDSLVYFNRRWNDTAPGTDSPDLSGAQNLVHVTLDSGERVVGLHDGMPGPPIPEDGAVLLGRGTGAAWLVAHAQPGQTMIVTHAMTPTGLVAAIGGQPVLLRNGKIQVGPGNDIHPRSAVGFNAERTRSWWVVIDGRSALSRGVSLHEMATILKQFGAEEALNLDGGGSSTLLARTAGAASALVQNLSSDGRERELPNGLGIFHSAETGSADQLFIQRPPSRDFHGIQPKELRLSPGAEFRPVAFATDKNINLIDLPGPVHWSVFPEDLGRFSPDGLFVANRSGRGEINASLSTQEKTVTASLPVLVIDSPVSIKVEPAELSLSPRQEVDLTVRALDARGFSAPLSNERIQWDVRGSIGEVIEGRFITGESTGSGALVATFEHLREVVPVGIGERPVLLAKFDAENTWKTNAVPEQTTSRLSFVNHLPFIREGGPTGKLDYDFSGTSRVRAAYLRPSEGRIKLPGRPLRLGLWIFGDGKQAWVRGQIADSAGTTHAIDFARNIDWTGWRYAEAEIPPGTNYPVSLLSIYLVETRPEVFYSGSVYFDELFAVHAPDLDRALKGGQAKVRDPANRSARLDQGRVDDFQFIVFGAADIPPNRDDPDQTDLLSALIEEINRHEVAMILYTGSLPQHTGEKGSLSGENFISRFRKPVYSTVGDFALTGEDGLARHRKLFGATHKSFRQGNSEFIILNSMRPGLRVSEEEQWPWLLSRLEETTADNLFLLTHTPVIDPLPGGKSGWSDQAETALFQKVLGQQIHKRRNVYSFHGHVHGFNRRAHDGVQYLTSAGGSFGPDKAGFLHYVLVTVKGTEITYQVIPLLERIEMAEEFAAAPGEAVALQACGIGPGGFFRFPLEYPAAVEWEIADPQVARIDPAGGRFQALQAGETTIAVRSGGKTASARLRVTR